jgi:small subunit ribosomal protein S5
VLPQAATQTRNGKHTMADDKQSITRQPSEFEDKVVQVNRVSKKTKGGNKMGFAVLVVVGDRKGRVGVGLGKSKDVQTSVRKAVKKAKKHLILVPMDGTTIPFAIRVKRGAGDVLLKPAPKGSGVIAGGPVRAVVELAGIRDVSSKILGSPNQMVNIYATFKALQQIQKLVELKGIKLKSIADIEREETKKLEALEHKDAKKDEKKAPAKDNAAAQTPVKTKSSPKVPAKKATNTK